MQWNALQWGSQSQVKVAKTELVSVTFGSLNIDFTKPTNNHFFRIHAWYCKPMDEGGQLFRLDDFVSFYWKTRGLCIYSIGLYPSYNLSLPPLKIVQAGPIN